MSNRSTLTPEERQAVQRHVKAIVAAAGSQEAAAERVGSTQQAISKAMHGGKVGYSFVRKLAASLGISVDAFFSETVVPATREANEPADIATQKRVDSDALPDASGLDTPALLDRVATLSRRQLRMVIDKSDAATQGSVELADAALELVHRLHRAQR